MHFKICYFSNENLHFYFPRQFARKIFSPLPLGHMNEGKKVLFSTSARSKTSFRVSSVKNKVAESSTRVMYLLALLCTEIGGNLFFPSDVNASFSPLRGSFFPWEEKFF